MNYLQAHARLGAIHKNITTETDPKVLVTLLDEAVRCCTAMSDLLNMMHSGAISQLRQEQLGRNQSNG